MKAKNNNGGLGAVLTYPERKVIARLISENKSGIEISSIIGRGKNCVNVEIRRNGGRNNYNADKAQDDSEKRIEKGKNKKSNHMSEMSRTEGYFNPFKHLRERIENLEMQIEILTETIKEMRNGSKKD